MTTTKNSQHPGTHSRCVSPATPRPPHTLQPPCQHTSLVPLSLVPLQMGVFREAMGRMTSRQMKWLVRIILKEIKVGHCWECESLMSTLATSKAPIYKVKLGNSQTLAGQDHPQGDQGGPTLLHEEPSCRTIIQGWHGLR